MLTEFETVVKKGRDERGWCSDRALRHRTLRHALRVRAQLEALTSDVLDVAGFVVDDSETKLKSSDSIVRGWCSSARIAIISIFHVSITTNHKNIPQITRISLKSQEIPQENRSKINTRTQVRDAITAGFFVVRQIFSLNINKKLHVHKNRTRRNSVEVQRIVHCTV